MPNFQDNEPLTTAAEVKQLHYKDDVDSGELAHHHTLGTRKNQAASGDRGFLTGDLKISARDTVPDGWLNCDGAAVNRTTYQALFMAIGTTYGAGDGSTTFNIPDMRDRFPIGSSGTKAVGSTGGASTKVIGTANLPTHTHGAGTYSAASAGSHRHDIEESHATGVGSKVARGTSTLDNTATAPILSDGAHTHNVTGSSGDGGFANNALDIQNPYLGLKFLIKT